MLSSTIANSMMRRKIDFPEFFRNGTGCYCLFCEDKRVSRKHWRKWWCLIMPLSTIIQLYRSDHLYWWSKKEDPEKNTDLSQDSDKLYHIMLCTSPWSRFELTTSGVICTHYIGSCKSNYHTITATTAPSANVFCIYQNAKDSKLMIF
jgi:hypothetical protein